MAFVIKDSVSSVVVKWMWILAILGVIFIGIFFVALSFQDLPTFEDLENSQENVASEVYSGDMSVLGRYYLENRVLIPYDDLSKDLVKALISTEDERYLKHSGIDFKALMRVVVKSLILRQETAGGGSTITQQLAKLLYDRPNRSGMGAMRRAASLASTKFKEWITAVKLERSYTKEEIIAMYLNHFNFLHNSHGVQSASEIYFGKPQEALSINEAATLVGMLKNPSRYNPIRRPELVQQRRMVVLSQMMDKGYLTREQYDSLKVEPLDMSNFRRSSHQEGLAPYFRVEMKKEIKRLLAQPENFQPDGTPYNVDRDGLRIYTTIDAHIQEHAEAAMVKHMQKVQKEFFHHWNIVRPSPWEYDEDDSDVELKLSNLDAQIRTTTRYQSMVQRILKPALAEVEKELDQTISARDIRRMLEEVKEPGYLNKIAAQDYITKKHRDFLTSLMRGDNWPKVKKIYDNFQQEVKKEFDTKVKMKIFSWESPQFEVDTMMSPLDSIMYHRKHLQTGILAVDPQNGHIKAWVGGIGMKYFQQDHIHTNRQIGSTFKPFVYSTAIAFQGISPCAQVLDIPYTISTGESNFNIPDDWSPKNSDGEYLAEPITLYQGLRDSKNTVSVYLMKQIGDTRPVRDLAANLGIDRSKIPPVPSLCLGSADISLFEMTGAYAAFANNGLYIKPSFIKHIEDKNGKLIYRHVPNEERVLQEDANYVMVDMLKYALAGRGGSAELKSEMGGKTGTTQNHSDGWFMGITPSLVVGTWVGGEDRWIRFRDLGYGQGSYMARPIFVDLIKRLEGDENADYDSKARFYVPPGELSITIDCDEYNQLNPLNEPEQFEEKEEVDFF